MIAREHTYLRLAVDLAILTVRQDALQVLVITRANEPFRGRAALPGGFLRDDEDIADAAVRELGRDRAGRQPAASGATEGLRGTGPGPRGRVVSVAFLAMMPDLPLPTAGSDASSAGWVPVDKALGTLAFDHDQILGEAVEQARSRLEFTTLATTFCGPAFTVGELRTSTKWCGAARSTRATSAGR